VLDEHVELFEGAAVEQQVDAFARGELALGVLGGDALFAAAQARARARRSNRASICFKGKLQTCLTTATGESVAQSHSLRTDTFTASWPGLSRPST